MSQQDNNEYPDQLKISDLYQSLKHEQPPEAIDQAILILAKQAGNTTEQSIKSAQFAEKHQTSKTKSNWRRWQWPLSIAASVMLISVIFINQYASFLPNSTVFSPEEAREFMVNSAPISAPSAEQKKGLLRKDAGLEKPATASSAAHNYAEKQALLIVNTELVQQTNGGLQAQQKQKEYSAETLAVQRNSKRVKIDEMPTQIKLSNIEQLRQQINTTQAQLLSLSQQQNDAVLQDSFTENSGAHLSLKELEMKALKAQISELQNALFKHMQSYYQHSPTWQVDNKLLKLLRIEQQQAWQTLSKQTVVQ